VAKEAMVLNLYQSFQNVFQSSQELAHCIGEASVWLYERCCGCAEENHLRLFVPVIQKQKKGKSIA
jgi:hypothetical protein